MAVAAATTTAAAAAHCCACHIECVALWRRQPDATMRLPAAFQQQLRVAVAVAIADTHTHTPFTLGDEQQSTSTEAAAASAAAAAASTSASAEISFPHLSGLALSKPNFASCAWPATHNKSYAKAEQHPNC